MSSDPSLKPLRPHREELPHSRLIHVQNLLRLYYPQPKQWDIRNVVLVTGGSSGIGAAIAEIYATRGCTLILLGRSEERLDAVRLRCEVAGSRNNRPVTVLTLVAELRDEMATIAALESLQLRRLNVVVLSAGVGGHQLWEDFVKDPGSTDTYRCMIETNLLPNIFLTKYFWRYLQRASAASQVARIVVLSSMSGELGLPGRSAYCASKFGLTGFFKSLQMEQSAVGITVAMPPTVSSGFRDNSIIPGSEQQEYTKSTMSTISAAHSVVEAADRGIPHAYFGVANYLASYVRPFIPRAIDKLIRKQSDLAPSSKL